MTRPAPLIQAPPLLLSRDLRAAAQQALEFLDAEFGWSPGEAPRIDALRAALAQQAEPDHETRAELAEQQVVQLAEERDHYRNLWQKAQQAEPVDTDCHTQGICQRSGYGIPKP
jgi:hypothetical protein